jgi:hypothetical protein
LALLRTVQPWWISFEKSVVFESPENNSTINRSVFLFILHMWHLFYPQKFQWNKLKSVVFESPENNSTINRSVFLFILHMWHLFYPQKTKRLTLINRKVPYSTSFPREKSFHFYSQIAEIGNEQRKNRNISGLRNVMHCHKIKMK